MLVAAFACGVAQAADLATLAQNLRSTDEATRMAAVDALSQTGAEAIGPLFDAMGGENRTTDLAARIAVQRMVHRAAAPGSRMDAKAVAQALAQEAASSRPVAVRSFAIRMLSYVGGDAEVPMLAGLLRDAHMAEMARWALMRIPGRASVVALAAAMPTAARELKIGLINALGARHDGSALPALEAAASSDDADVRAAALAAIGRIPDSRAEKILKTSIESAAQTDKTAAWEAYVRLGEEFLAAGKPDAAERVYSFMYEKAPNDQLRCAGIMGLGKVGSANGVNAALDALASRERNLRGAAVEALVAAPGSRATTLIADRMLSWSTGPRTLLAGILGRRGDRAALKQLAAASRDHDQPLRLAATAALGETGDPAALPALALRLRDGSQPVRDAALFSLVQLSSAPATRGEIMAMAERSPGMRGPLLRVMADWDDPTLMPMFLEAARSPNAEVAVAGLLGIKRLLGHVLDPAVESQIESELVRLAETGPPAVQSVALTGYLTLADRRRATEGAATLEMYHRALRLAPDDENRESALRGIAAIGSVDSLPYIEPFLDSGGVMGEAAAAAIPIAEKLAQAGDKDQAVEVFRKAVRATSDRGLLSTAIERLRALGVEMDIAAEAGFITHWWVLGPFRDREKMTATDVVPTDAPIDLAAPVVADDTTYKWKYVNISDPLGMIDFRAVVAPMDDVAAYAYAEVTSDADRDVIFKIGSDDSVACWLNGARIHFHDVDRGYAPDEDIVPTRLRTGMNYILMKVLNGGADWAGGLRITDTNDVPLRLQQRRP